MRSTYTKSGNLRISSFITLIKFAFILLLVSNPLSNLTAQGATCGAATFLPQNSAFSMPAQQTRYFKMTLFSQKPFKFTVNGGTNFGFLYGSAFACTPGASNPATANSPITISTAGANFTNTTCPTIYIAIKNNNPIIVIPLPINITSISVDPSVDVQLVCPTINNLNVVIQDAGMSPIEFCTNAGVKNLSVTATDLMGNAICLAEGTFSGPGVVDGSNNTGTFNPLLATPGLYSIKYTYTCPNGSVVIHSTPLEVKNTPLAVLKDYHLECVVPNGTMFLSNMFDVTSSQTGTWLFQGGPAGAPTMIDGENYTYTMPGCYQFEFTADDPDDCYGGNPPSDIAFAMITTNPVFDFSLSSGGGCLASGSESISATVTTTETAPQSWTVNGAAVTLPYSIPTPPVFGALDYNFCLTLTKPLSASCGSSTNSTNCAITKCTSISFYNDGLNCQSNCESITIDVCNVDVKPRLTLVCKFFAIEVPFDIVGSNISPNQQVLSCSDDHVIISYNSEIFGIDPNFGTGGGATIGSLPGISVVCDVLNFCICVDFGLFEVSIRPFKTLYDLLGCDKTIAQLIFGILGSALGGDGGGAVVVADTDGDGAFDYNVDKGAFPLSGVDVSVPVNVKRQGEITIRMVSAWPNSPIGVCGQITKSGDDLLALLPIGAIPVVGIIIEELLEAAGCNVPLSWSNEETVSYKVINNIAPVFLNCPSTTGYTFSQDFSCDTEANWSIPVAQDGCSGVALIFKTDILTTEGVRKVSGPDPGDDLAIGVYTVVYEATACNGMTTQCSFPIEINAGDPQLLAPNDITVGTDIDLCSAVIVGLAPLKGIGCNTVITYESVGATVLSGGTDISGSTFNLGVTTVTYTMTYDDDGDINTPPIVVMDSFVVTVEDRQKPTAECATITVQLDNLGMVTVNAIDVDALSSDNCTIYSDLSFRIKKLGDFGSSVSFDCSEKGTNFVTLEVTDEANNVSFCLATVEVLDFFDGFQLTLDAPELCLEANNPEQFDFTNYLSITRPNGTIIMHSNVSGLGGDVIGVFGITSFIPSEGNSGVVIGTSAASPNDIGYIDPLTGIYTPGTGTGFVTISYLLTIGNQVSQDNAAIMGCFLVVHETFELKQPLVMDSPECECLDVNFRIVDLGVVTGGLEPYRLEYAGGTLDLNRDGIPDDTDGIYTYDQDLGHDIDDVMEDLGRLLLNYTSPIWSISLVDARGCEIARSGSCDVPDLVSGPEIDCMGTNDFDTEVFICERQYSWLHALPFDNCAVFQYSYTITNPDGTISGPFSLNALIDDSNPGIPLDELFEAEYEFELGTSTVSYYAEDAVGNIGTCSFDVIVEDNDPPYFINCPKPDVIVATEFGHCDAFVNFSLPLAEDNCVMPIVTQIDGTGLSTGDRFPIGTTILVYQAVDAVGNKAICKVKVIVNNYWNVPEITCPQDIEVNNDDWLCSAVVNNIAPVVTALCADDLIVSYQVEFENEVIGTGLVDASGFSFPVGNSTVTYRTQNQPLLLISEIAQDADALLGGMNPPPITNEFQCFSDSLFAFGNGDAGEGLVYYPTDDVIYHFSGATDGNEYFEEIYFPGECVQPNHVSANIHGPDPASQITGMVYDPVTMKFIAMDTDGNIFNVSTTGDYFQQSTYVGPSLAGFAIVGGSFYGVDPLTNDLHEFNPVSGATITTVAMSSTGEAITTGIDIVNDPLSGDVYIIYNTGASATSYIGTLDVVSGVITETGDTFIDFAGITINSEGIIYGVSSDNAGPDLYTITCAIPGDDYIEITNFGPGTYDVSCLVISRECPNGLIETYVVPQGTVLVPGDVLVLHYGPGVNDDTAPGYFYNLYSGSDQDAGSTCSYTLSYGNNTIDAMSMFANADAGIIREDLYDTDTAADFVLAEDCLALTLNEYNPIYPPAFNNGSATALQTEPKATAECDFVVTVIDTEAPMCMEIDDMKDYQGPAILAVEGECNESVISVPEADDCILTEINVGIIGNIVGAEFITISLTSPQGEILVLYDKLCVGDASVDIVFDDEAVNDINTLCQQTPTWNGAIMPQGEMLMKFYTSKLAGDWTLLVEVEDGNDANFDITSWSIEATCMEPWQMDDVVINNDLGDCGALFTWIHPYFVDNCTVGTISVNYFSDDADLDVPSGGLLTENFGKGGFEVTEFFSVGTTVVEYTLIDASNNQSQCSFTVTVIDAEDPIITFCPNDIVISLDAGECRMAVNYEVLAEDNCEVTSIIGVPPSGTFFEIGTTIIVVIVTDPAGNTAECTFTITILEYVPTSNELACNDNLNVSLDPNCTAVLTADMILEGGNHRCYENYCITITTLGGVPHPNMFDITDENQTFIVTISDCLNSGNSCWGYITIEEKLLPEIVCPDDIVIYCNQDPDELINGVFFTGEAFIANCEPNATISWTDDYTGYAQCDNPRAQIVRTWTVLDSDDNVASCEQLITIVPFVLDDVKFPIDFSFENGNEFECTDVNMWPLLTSPNGYLNDGGYVLCDELLGGNKICDGTGNPTINGVPVQTSGALCMISVNVSDEIYDICGGSYEILRTWKVRNMCEPLLSGVNPREHIQIIKVLDTQGPKMLGVPDDITISTDPWSCKATQPLPIPTLIDDYCSNPIVFDANVFGGGYITLFGSVETNDLVIIANNFAKGDHIVRYEAFDACYNVTVREFIVTVADLAPPVALAKLNIVVSLTAGQGQGVLASAKLFALDVDNGSYDGCGQIKVEVRRPAGSPSCENIGNFGWNNNITFNNTFGQSNDNNNDTDDGAFVRFCCEDAVGLEDANGVYGEHLVIMRVYDDANMNGIPGDLGDNYNETWVTVRVENKLQPVITCTDVTLECWMDWDDLTMAPGPNTFSVCGAVDFALINVIDQTSPCGDGIVIKNWGIDADGDGFVDGATCTQIITLVPSQDIFDGNIQFPSDVVTDCIIDTVVVAPIWNEGVCDLIGWSHIDEVFTIEADACWKILRHYTVINWCTDEIWEHTQVLKYIDSEDPELVCEDKMFAGDSTDPAGNPLCGRYVTLTKEATDPGNCPSQWFEWYITVDLWSDNTIDWIFTSGQEAYVSATDNILPIPRDANVSLAIPELIANSCYDHTVKYTVQDGCNNATSCTETFMVVDKKAPTPYCVNLSSAIMQNGQVTLWAIDFDLGGFDDCTESDHLKFTFSDTPPSNDPNFDSSLRSSYRSFTCDGDDPDGDGIVDIQVYIWDNATCDDNYDFCNVTLVLSNCGNGGSGRVAGGFVTNSGEMIENVSVGLGSDNLINSINIMTNNDGQYYYDNVPYGIDYVLEAEKNDDYLNGVSTLDLIIIQKHILGINVLDSPYEMIAADANSSHTITALDLISLRKLILGIYNELPYNDSWRFVDGTQSLTMANPWIFTEKIYLVNLQADQMNNNFKGIKIGDVNGSVIANATSNVSKNRAENTLIIEVNETKLIPGQTAQIDIYSSNFSDVGGFQLTMNFDGLKLNGVESGALDIKDGNIAIFDHQMSMSYSTVDLTSIAKDQVLFTLDVTAVKFGEISDMIDINSDITIAEAYIGQGLEIANIEWANRSNDEAATEEYVLYQNEPNPFSGLTTISFKMAKNAEATLVIYDVTGKVLKTISGNYKKGINTITLVKSDFGTDGAAILYYQIDSEDFTDTKKMILIE